MTTTTPASKGTSDGQLPTFSWPAETMTVTEVAATVRYTPKTVRQHIRAGRLRAVQFQAGGPYAIHRDDAQTWVVSFIVEADRRQSVDRQITRRRSALAGAPRASRPPSRPITRP